MLYFTCLSSNLTGSSVWAQSKDVRILWASLLSMADPDGVVCENIMGIANRSYLTLEETTAAMEVLTSPDPYSSTTAHEGRRVIKNGNAEWVIVNHTRYQEMFMEQHRREKNRKRMQMVREEMRQIPNDVPPEICAQSVQGCVPSNSNSNSNSNKVSVRAPAKKVSRGSTTVPESWGPNDRHRVIAKDLGVDLAHETERFRDHEFSRPKKDFDRAFSNWLRSDFTKKLPGTPPNVKPTYTYKPGMR